MSNTLKILEKIRAKPTSKVSVKDYTLAMEELISGTLEDALVADFLRAQSQCPVSKELLVAAVHTLEQHMLPVDIGEDLRSQVVDTCGTGGDGFHTFNISTTAAFLAAGAGAKVAKHGNRSASSKSGSADVLEALGLSLEMDVEQHRENLLNLGFTFFFAPRFHHVLKNVAHVRKQLGIRTFFNCVGPLANPAKAAFQVLGVYDAALQRPMVESLKELGCRRAWVVHGEDGLDEISLVTKTRVIELHEGQIHEFVLNPEDYGFSLCHIDDLRGGTPKENAAITEQILQNHDDPKLLPKKNIAILNAAASVLVSGLAQDFEKAIGHVRHGLDSGYAMQCLEDLRA